MDFSGRSSRKGCALHGGRGHRTPVGGACRGDPLPWEARVAVTLFAKPLGKVAAARASHREWGGEAWGRRALTRGCRPLV